MIITQAPYRVSFAGGGTDLPAFYKNEYGAVLSAAVNFHMYVTISPRFDSSIRVSYTKTEIANSINQIEHEIVREALNKTKLDRHLEITTIGDVPAGTGLGSSSSLTVGLLQALYAYKGEIIPTKRIAEEACRIEIDVLGKPIGKQDQYAAAYGGLNYIRFQPNGVVEVEPVPCRSENLEFLEKRILMFYTKQQRSADIILDKQSRGTEQKFETLVKMRDLAGTMRDVISSSENLNRIGELLHEGWKLKRSLGFGISNSSIDSLYETARDSGALGGKLLGAGGGGFILLFASPEFHENIRNALGRPQELSFKIDQRGSRVIFINQR